jgi:hypothetical protein
MTVKEITVKSFSMAMGIRRPGFQLLSLTSTISSVETLTQLPNSPPSPLDTPCFLPDQLGIYLSVYVPFIVLSLLSLLAFNIHRCHTRNNKRHQRRPEDSPRFSHRDHSAGHATNEYEISRRPFGRNHTEYTDEDPLPPPVTKQPARSSKLRSRFSSSSWSFYLLGRRRRITVTMPCSRVDRGMQDVGLLRGFLSDVLDVAWPPALVFCVAAWWAMHF